MLAICGNGTFGGKLSFLEIRQNIIKFFKKYGLDYGLDYDTLKTVSMIFISLNESYTKSQFYNKYPTTRRRSINYSVIIKAILLFLGKYQEAQKIPDLKGEAFKQNIILKQYWDEWNAEWPEIKFSWYKLRWRQIFLKVC